MSDTTRVCIECLGVKPLSDFAETRKLIKSTREYAYYKRGKCKACRQLAKKLHARTLAGTPEAKRKKQLETIKWRHGMSADEYLAMVEKQENLCAICGQPPGSKALAIDHDHTTNKTRDLLCVSCNFGIGWFKDNIEVMKQAIAYIEKHNELAKSKPERGTIIDWGSGARPAKVRRLRTINRPYGQR